jgi:hypothetical protein
VGEERGEYGRALIMSQITSTCLFYVPLSSATHLSHSRSIHLLVPLLSHVDLNIKKNIRKVHFNSVFVMKGCIYSPDSKVSLSFLLLHSA